MAFESLADFVQMGRHGVYVWSAYGISLLLIAANLVAMFRRSRRVRADIQRAHRREQLVRDRDQ